MKVGEEPEYSELGKRDAIHVAYIIAECDICLPPGTSVQFTDNNLIKVESCSDSERHGITDPFMTGPSNLVTVLIEPKYVNQISHNFDLNVDELRYDHWCPPGCG